MDPTRHHQTQHPPADSIEVPASITTFSEQSNWFTRLLAYGRSSKDERVKHATRNTVDEQAPLLGHDSLSNASSPEAILIDQVHASWRQETRIIAVYAAPLALTSLLQFSILATSTFVVGGLGSIELGAVTVAHQSAFITTMTPIQGLVTSLDTLCAQAFGAGNSHLVGVHCQRMTLFLLLLCVPIIILWTYAEEIFLIFLPNPKSAELAGLYLRNLAFGVPGFALFEVGKRFVQAQCLFRATTYVLLIAAPVNVLLHWFLVWKMEMGFVGAPIAAALTLNLLPALLLLYVLLVDGSKCWGGFSSSAFVNWFSMLKLAIPAMVMLVVEWTAFEAMTLFISRFGTDYLAAQSILMTTTNISYQIPFALSIAISTRVAHLIGAGEVIAAKATSKVAFGMVSATALINLAVYVVFRYQIPLLFTSDETITTLAAVYLPLVALVQVFDGVSEGAHGLLRGIGRQYIGGSANIIAYYVIALPVALVLCLGLDWKLGGMWTGMGVGLVSASLIEYTYLLNANWDKAALEAEVRNAAG